LGYVSDSTYKSRRLQAFNPATKKLFEYGLIGLAIGAVLVAGLQFRPQAIFPSQGTLDIKLTDGVPVAQLTTQSPSSDSCHGNCNATSISLTITMIEVHTSGINNMTGEWTQVCTSQLPMTINLTQLPSVTENLCGTKFQPEAITNMRLSVSAGVAEIPGVGIKALSFPSGKLEIPLSPLAEISAGKTTTITVDFVFQSHIVCPGNGGNCKLTPVLHAMSDGPT
jgi:Domain of unknown function (DUF4382)